MDACECSEKEVCVFCVAGKVDVIRAEARDQTIRELAEAATPNLCTTVDADSGEITTVVLYLPVKAKIPISREARTDCIAAALHSLLGGE